MIDKVKEAKQILGSRAKDIIISDFNITWNTKNNKGICPFHKEKTASFSWDNKKLMFHCFGCTANYDIVDHFIRKYGTFKEAAKELFKETGIDYRFEKAEIKTKRSPKAENTTEKNNAYKYLQSRGISKHTCEYADIKQDSAGNIVFEYYNQDDNIGLVKYRPSKNIEKGEIKAWCQKDVDHEPILYLMHKADPTKPLLICEGEIDCLSAITAGFRNTVSIPLGAGNTHWVAHNFEWLNQFSEIILWADNDQAGKKMISELLPRLDENRVKVVSVKEKDINELLLIKGTRFVMDAIEKAEYAPVKGVVDLADIEDFDFKNAKFLSSGFKGLNKWTNGFLYGTLVVLFGINGSGKTALINQMCVCEPLSQGEKVFIYSGEMPRPQLKNIIEIPMAGPDNIEIKDGANGSTIHIVEKSVREQIKEWYKSKVLVYCDDSDVSYNAIISKMEAVAKRHGVKVFVLDNLAVIDLCSSENEKYTKQKEMTRLLVNFAKKYNAVVFLATHPREHDTIKRLSKLDISGSADISNLAHYVISTHRVTDDEKEDKKDKKGNIVDMGCPYDMIMDLHKNRPLGHQDKSIGLKFEIKSKRFYGDSDAPDKNYGWENNSEQLDWVIEAEKLLGE